MENSQEDKLIVRHKHTHEVIKGRQRHTEHTTIKIKQEVTENRNINTVKET